MNYKIEERESFRVVGIKETISTIDGENLRRIPQLWQEKMSPEFYGQIMELNEGDLGLLGVCSNIDEINNTMDYYICVPSNKTCPEGFAELEVPATSWANFEAIGPVPESIQNTWHYIFGEWVNNTEYELGMGPNVEVYPEDDLASPDYKAEVWIPIKRKS